MTKYIIKPEYNTICQVPQYCVYKVGWFRDKFICGKNTIEECYKIIQHLEQKIE